MSHEKITLSQLEQYLSKAAWILKGPVDAADFKVYIFPLLFLIYLQRGKIKYQICQKFAFSTVVFEIVGPINPPCCVCVVPTNSAKADVEATNKLAIKIFLFIFFPLFVLIE